MSLSSNASSLRTLRGNITQLKSGLNYLWKSGEILKINTSIDFLTSQMSSVSSNLDCIGTDISEVADEIRREEEAARAAAAAAAAEARAAQTRYQEAQIAAAKQLMSTSGKTVKK